MKRALLLLVACCASIAVPYCAWRLLIVGAATGAIIGTVDADKLLPPWRAQGTLWTFALFLSAALSALSFYFALRRPRSNPSPPRPEPPDKRPSKVIMFVIPSAFAVLSAFFAWPGPRNLFDALATGAFVYFFSLVFLLAAWHGFRFFRSFFQNRGGDSQ